VFQVFADIVVGIVGEWFRDEWFRPGKVEDEVASDAVAVGAHRYDHAVDDEAASLTWLSRLQVDQTDGSSVDFLTKVHQACPVKIVKLLTDNGSQFTDRYTAGGKKKEPSGTHVFDRLCKQLGIEHRLIPPRHPQTNGMVERFNGRISDIVNQTRFGSAAELESTLRN
jgi:hypothetical protein